MSIGSERAGSQDRSGKIKEFGSPTQRASRHTSGGLPRADLDPAVAQRGEAGGIRPARSLSNFGDLSWIRWERYQATVFMVARPGNTFLTPARTLAFERR